MSVRLRTVAEEAHGADGAGAMNRPGFGMTGSAFQGELMLAGWKDTHNGGATVTFWLPDPAELDVFRGMTAKKGNVAGQRFMAVLVEVQDDEKTAAAPSPTGQTLSSPTESVPAAAPNRLASWLHSSGYFRSPKLWAAMDAAGLYTREKHKRHIEGMECIGWGHLEHSGDVCLHHVKTAENSGVGHKPPHFYGVPLCFRHHRDWAHGTGSLCATRKDKQDLLERAVALTAENMKAALKVHLNLVSLRDLTLDALHRVEYEIGLPLTKWSET